MMNECSEEFEFGAEPSRELVRYLSARIGQLELLLAEMLLKNQQLRFSLCQRPPEGTPKPLG